MLAVAAKLGPVLRVDMPCLAVLAVIDGEHGPVLAEANPIEMLSSLLGRLLLRIDLFSTHHHKIIHLIQLLHRPPIIDYQLH